MWVAACRGLGSRSSALLSSDTWPSFRHGLDLVPLGTGCWIDSAFSTLHKLEPHLLGRAASVRLSQPKAAGTAGTSLVVWSWLYTSYYIICWPVLTPGAVLGRRTPRDWRGRCVPGEVGVGQVGWPRVPEFGFFSAVSPSAGWEGYNPQRTWVPGGGGRGLADK